MPICLKQLLFSFGVSVIFIYRENAADLNRIVHTAYKTATPATPLHCPPLPNITRLHLKRDFLQVELSKAVYAGDFPKLKALVTNDSFFLRDGFGNTLVHLAANRGNIEMLRFLIGKDKSLIEARGKEGKTPLMIATLTGKSNVVKFLLEIGADPNAKAEYHSDAGIKLEVNASSTHLAAGFGYLDIVKMLLQHGGSCNDGFGLTPLHLAAKTGHLEVVEYLVDWCNGGNSTSTTAVLGSNMLFAKYRENLPIHVAAIGKRTHIVLYLARVDPRQVEAHGRYNNTVLHIAARNNDAATLQGILKYQPDLEELAYYDNDPEGTPPSVTALILAAGRGHESTVRMLLEAGANDTAIDWKGDSALHRATEWGHLAVVEILLDKNPRSVNLTGDRDYTALHYAVEYQNYEIVRLLLKRRASLSATAKAYSPTPLRLHSMRDVFSGLPSTTTPLLFAAMIGNLQIFRLLVESGAHVDQPNAQSGDFPVHLAARYGHIAIVEVLVAWNVCQLEWRGERERTALSAAIDANQTVVAEYLIREGANLEVGSRYSNYRGENAPTARPLILATQKGNSELIEELLRNGASPNLADEHGSTALHYAAMQIETQPSELLIRYGAQGSRESIYGETPMEITFNAFSHTDEHLALLVMNHPLPLHRAVEKENAPLVRKAVHYLPNRLEQRSELGETALEMAVRLEKLPMVGVLIEAGLRVDTVSTDGNTLLHRAASVSNETKRWKLVEMILRELGADAKHLLQLRNDTMNENVIDIAARDNVLAAILRRAVGDYNDSAAVTRPVMGRSCAGCKKYGRQLQYDPSLSTPAIIRRQATSHCPQAPANNSHPQAANSSLPSNLITALYAGDLPKLKTLLTQKNILLRDKLGNTLAVLAARKGNINALRYLISNEPALINATSVTGYTPLHIASKLGYTEIVKFLLDVGADVNAVAKSGGDRTGWWLENRSEDGATATPLHLAAKEGRLDSVNLLLQYGANITASDWHDRTPLHWAVMIGHLDVVKQLVSFSEDSNSLDATLFAREADGDMPIHDAAYVKNADIVRYLAGVDPRQVEAHGLNNNTILHSAARDNDPATLQEILSYQPDLMAMANYDDDPEGTPPSVTALMLAAGNGHERIVRMLLEAGANDTAINWKGDSAVHLAAKWGHRAVVEAMLDKHPQSVNLTGDRDCTPLHYAVANQDYEMVRLLLKRRADLSARAAYWDVSYASTPSATPLLFAVRVGNLQIFTELVESGAHVDQPDSQSGDFPIHLAARKGHIAIVKELLAWDACQLEWRGKLLKTALGAAIAAGQTEIADYLMRKGANVEAKSLFTDDQEDNEPTARPLLWAVGKLNQVLVEALLHHGADPNIVDKFGNTLLHRLLLHVQTYPDPIVSGITDLLIRYGAKVNVEDADGLTSTEQAFFYNPDGEDFRLLVAKDPQPLHRAVEKGNAALIKKAIFYLPFRLQQRNSKGETALEMAVRLGKVEVAVAMIKAGIRTDTSNNNGNTLLHIAANHHNTTIRDQLLEMIMHDAGTDVLPSLLTRSNKTGLSMIDIAKRDPTVANQLHKAIGRNFTVSLA